jgi:cytochrome c oxidase subunit 1
MMGQMQLNMTWHNTLATVGHFHATVALGTTLAFMGLGYYVLRLVFGREWILEPVAMVQPYLYAGAMSIVVLMMMYLGILYGIPRRHPSVTDIPGTYFDFAAAEPLFIIFGVAALVAILAGALFVVAAVGTLVAGGKYDGSLPVDPPAAFGSETTVPDGGGASSPDGGADATGTSTPDGGADATDSAGDGTAGTAESDGEASTPPWYEDAAHHALSMRGTFTMTLVFLATFFVLWALNWYLLSQLWQVG